MAYRIETTAFDKAEPAAGGGLRIPAAIGRTGILVYRKADGSEWREYRPPEEAFSSESLSSLRGAPVTDLHPMKPVTPESYRAVARGHVGDDARKDDDGRHIAASVYIHDAALIHGVAEGMRGELSAGYEVDIEETAGMSPEGPYDAIQRNIRYNHLAVIPTGAGRAGPTVKLRLDSELNQIPEPARAEGDGNMKIKIRLRGRTYTVDADETAAEALPAALEEEASEMDKLKARIKELEAELAAAKGETADAEEAKGEAEKERDEEKGRADALEEAAKKTTSPEAVQALVKARLDLERKAGTINPELRCDGLSDREVMAKAINFDATEEHSDDYVRARFDTIAEQAAKGRASLGRVHQATVTSGGNISIAEAARLRMIARNERGEA